MPNKISTKCNVFLQLIILRPHPHFTRHVRKKNPQNLPHFTRLKIRRSADPHFTGGPISIPSGILIHPAIWPQQIWAENWGCPFRGRGARYPSNTMWPWPTPTCMPSFILIHPTFGQSTPTSQRDRQDNGPIAQGEPFYKESPKNYKVETHNKTTTKHTAI